MPLIRGPPLPSGSVALPMPASGGYWRGLIFNTQRRRLECLDRAEEPAEADKAARRADKAAYLKEKLREQSDAAGD